MHWSLWAVKRIWLLFLFTTYSYFMGIISLLLDVSPYPVRILIFKVMFRKMGKGVLIDYKAYFRYPSKISLGENVAINRGCEFYAVHQAEGGTITVGNNVAFGPYVRVFAGGHDYSSLELPVTADPIVIHDYVWVGGNSTILQGVVIGEGAVIGAGSVVTKDIPSYTIAAGNPARVLRPRILS
jgi:acetyltransferase-like isoleucine patch superfamily enzyme